MDMETARYTILIVVDDDTIARLVSDRLSRWGMETVVVEDFSAVLDTFVKVQPHLVLLDISLPFCNGYHWCEEIRRLSKAPIIFLSSASDNLNIVMAMNMGGDDFIAKPFDLEVLTAKVQALLRRTYDFQGQAAFLEHRGALLRLGDPVLTYRDKRVELTRNEYKILQLLMENKGRVLSRELLMKHLWESESFIDDNTLTVNVARLRKKLEEMGLEDFIVTKKGLGYLVEA